MTLECRPTSDMALVIDLARRSWPVAYAEILSPEQIANLLMRIYNRENLEKEQAEGHRFWAAYLDGVAAGFASGYREGEAIWIKKLYVLPDCQGRGIGRALMDVIIGAFRPADEIRLLVNNRNLAAQRFYERCGFTRADAVPVMMGDFAFTDYIFVRSIRPPLS